MKIIKTFFGNTNFRVSGDILSKDSLSIKKFQFTSSGGPCHGMALFLNTQPFYKIKLL